MATTANIHAPLGAATILRVADGISHAFEAVAEWNTARKTRKLLSQLSDAQLEDIGLAREDIAKI